MKYTDTLMELYRVYIIKDNDIKYNFFHNIKMKYYKRKLKKVIRKKVREEKLHFVDYEWVLEKILGDNKYKDLYLHCGLNSYDCHIQDDGFIQLDIKKYEYNIYKQKNDLTDIFMRLRFSIPIGKGQGELYVELNTGYTVYTGALSNIALFTGNIDNFIRYLNKWDYKNKSNPIDTSYYVPLHILMVNLIEKVFELEEQNESDIS